LAGELLQGIRDQVKLVGGFIEDKLKTSKRVLAPLEVF
jgi:hypothetical protein